MQDNDVLLKRKDVMNMLKIRSVNTLYKLLKKKQLIPMKISGGIEVYWRRDVLKFLEDLKQNAS